MGARSILDQQSVIEVADLLKTCLVYVPSDVLIRLLEPFQLLYYLLAYQYQVKLIESFSKNFLVDATEGKHKQLFY